MLKEWEKTSCSRCGGSGRYSWCEMYGDKCFKCHGSGKQLTKRGEAALAWYRNRLEVPASEIRPDDYIRTSGMKFVVGTISQDIVSKAKSMKPDGTWLEAPPYLHFVNRDGKMGCSVFSDTKVQRLGRTVAARNAMLMEAFAYQDTLTKAGTVRKR